MPITQCYHGTLTTVNVYQPIAEDGANSTVTLNIPAGVSRITEIHIESATDLGASVVNVGAGLLIRLSGQGIADGEQILAGPAIQNQGVTSGVSTVQASKVYRAVNLAVKAGAVYNMAGSLTPTDPGDTEVYITLVFE